MAYIALYRKWRPGSFKELVGQEHISRTLSNAILTGKIGHAYLFSGPRGTGKTSTAKIFAKALNCEQGPTPDPCNTCENCRKINDGTSMDVFEIDAASNRGIDEIRELRETVKFAPADGHYKVYIIDEVHMLTAEAFNALLKTLEEPPAHVVFILATTEAHKVPATIQSRCQRYDFKRITTQEIIERLRYVTQDMEVSVDPEALSLIALQADGGMRDALSILDQCSALSGQQGITAERVREILGLVGHVWIWKMTQALAACRSQDLLQILAELLRDGKDMKQILIELALHMRSLMIYQAAGALEGLDLYDEQEKVLREQCGLFTQDRIMMIIHRLHEAMNEMKWSPQPRITLEVALLSLCRVAEEATGRAANSADQSASSAGDHVRIARLEARLAQLTAAADSLVTPTASSAGSTVVLPKQRRAQAPAPLAPSTAGKAELRSESALQEAETTVHADGKAVWQQVMGKLKAEGKKPVLACVEKGIARGMSDTQFFVVFHSKILQQLTERNYRRVLEPILQEITGQPLQLVCELERIAPVAKAPPKVKQPPKAEVPEDAGIQVDMDALPPEERNRLQTAIDVFGNHFVELKEEKKE